LRDDIVNIAKPNDEKIARNNSDTIKAMPRRDRVVVTFSVCIVNTPNLAGIPPLGGRLPYLYYNIKAVEMREENKQNTHKYATNGL
jgi:hypothetical protein